MYHRIIPNLIVTINLIEEKNPKQNIFNVRIKKRKKVKLAKTNLLFPFFKVHALNACAVAVSCHFGYKTHLSKYIKERNPSPIKIIVPALCIFVRMFSTAVPI